jgi:hypothetical protein
MPVTATLTNSFQAAAFLCYSSSTIRFKQEEHCVISGICRKVEDNCALLRYYTESSGNFLLTF